MEILFAIIIGIFAIAVCIWLIGLAISIVLLIFRVIYYIIATLFKLIFTTRFFLLLVLEGYFIYCTVTETPLYFEVLGENSLFYAVATGLIIAFLYLITQFFPSYNVEEDVIRVFKRYETATYGEIYSRLKKRPSEKAFQKVLESLYNEGLIETIDLHNGEQLLKWVGSGHFSQGMIRKEIHVD